MCRFCPGNKAAVDALMASTFQAAVLVGTDAGSVQQAMREIEEQGVLRCATMFCTDCQRVSLIVPEGSDDKLASICWTIAWARRFYAESMANQPQLTVSH